MGDNPSNILVDETQYPIHIAGKGNAICKRQSNTSRCWAAALSSLLGSTRSPPAEQSDLEQINVDLTENGIVQSVRNKQVTIGRKLLGADDGSLPDALRNNEIPFVLTAVFNLENPIHLEGNVWPLIENKLKSDHLVIIMFSRSDWYNPDKKTGPCAGLPCWHWWVVMGVKEVAAGMKMALIMNPDPKKTPCIRWEFLDTPGATQPWQFNLAWKKIGADSSAEKHRWTL